MLRDFSAASRMLRRTGTLPAVVVLMLGTAIAAATSIFSIAHAVLLRPLPIVAPERLVILWGRDDARAQSVVEVSLGDLRQWRTNTTLTALEIFGSVNWSYRVTAPGEPFSAAYSSVSAGFFDTLGARAMLGRTFRPDDDRAGAPRIVVLSADLWRRRFSSDPGIVGTAVTVGEGPAATPYQVVGVMGPDFRFPAGAELWTPAGREMADLAKGGSGLDALRVFYALGRLKDTATIATAETELSMLARRGEISRGERDSRMTAVVTPFLEHLFGPARGAILAIAGAALMLLLIACANAAGLLMVRGAARQCDVAVHLALGATRWQVIRQFLAESILLTALAGSLGVGLAFLTFEASVALAPVSVPRLEEAAINTPALLFALTTCVATALLIGVIPAWQYSGSSLLTALQQRSRTGTTGPRAARIRKTLVVAQLASAVVLLAAGGLFARSFVSLLGLDLGFEPRQVLTFDIYAPEARYGTIEKQRALTDEILDRTARTPGVVAAGAVLQRPFAHGPIGMDGGVVIEGQPLSPESSRRNPIVNWESATPDYFRAIGTRLVRGRTFDARDVADAPLVVVVSEGLAARLWPGQDPLGKRLLTHGSPEGPVPVWQTVVGVVADARYREIQTARYDVFLPHRQAPNNVQHYMIRVSGDPLAFVPSLKAVLGRIDPEVTIGGASKMEDVVGRTMSPWRFSTVVFTVFSVMALMFAAVGLAALIAYAVTQRRREIGVRMALGARAADVVRLLVAEGVWITAAGLAIGIPGAWLVTRSLSSLLFGVSPDDALTYAAVTCVLAGVSILAAYLPARKAAAVDPMTALREGN